MEYFWIGGWQHIILGEHIPDSEGNRPVIRLLCFGPLETREYGITADNSFYYKEHIIEGIGAGEKIFEIIDVNEFLAAIDCEAALCQKYVPHLVKYPSDIREKIRKGELP